MRLFSQRIGKTPIKSIIQTESIDDDLKNALWNGLTIFYWKEIQYERIVDNDEEFQGLLIRVWKDFFKKRLDEQPIYFDTYLKQLKEFFFQAEWYQVYDFIEFVPQNFISEYYHVETNKEYIEYCNETLETELSAYRFVHGKIAQISSKEEVESIEEALLIPDKFKPVKVHLNTALELFSDKKSPDYRNSIKESISALESYCSIIINDPKITLGQALKQIEKDNKIHPALKNSLSNLYGYTSNADGIRHGLLEESNLSHEDAKFMLVVCSAFINYLMQKEIKRS